LLTWPARQIRSEGVANDQHTCLYVDGSTWPPKRGVHMCMHLIHQLVHGVLIDQLPMQNHMPCKMRMIPYCVLSWREQRQTRHTDNLARTHIRKHRGRRQHTHTQTHTHTQAPHIR
jgi:hypothetical protein